MYCLCCCHEGFGPKPLNQSDTLILRVEVVWFSIYLISTSIFRGCDSLVLHLHRRETKTDRPARVAKATRNGGQHGVRKKTSIQAANTQNQYDLPKLGWDRPSQAHGTRRWKNEHCNIKLLARYIRVIGMLFVRWFKSRSLDFLIGYCIVGDFSIQFLLLRIKINQL